MLSFDESLKACQKCDLRGNCPNVVLGDGNPQSKVLVVGDLPRGRSVSEGMAFLDTSEVFFKTLLRNPAGVSPKELFYSYLVHCPTPEERAPFLSECESCWPWLAQTIKHLQPKVIITLGDTTGKFIATKLGVRKPIGNKKIIEYAGFPVEDKVHNVVLYPIDHPENVIHFKPRKMEYREHFMYLKFALKMWLSK